MSETQEDLLKAWLEAEDDYRDDVAQYFVASWANAPSDRKPKVLQAEDFARFDEKRTRIDELRSQYEESWRE